MRDLGQLLVPHGSGHPLDGVGLAEERVDGAALRPVLFQCEEESVHALQTVLGLAHVHLDILGHVHGFYPCLGGMAGVRKPATSMATSRMACAISSMGTMRSVRP